MECLMKIDINYSVDFYLSYVLSYSIDILIWHWEKHQPIIDNESQGCEF